jgi:imidazolonepropionase
LASTLVRAGAIVTCDTDASQNGITFEQLGLIKDGAILVEDGVIKAVSSEATLCHGEPVEPRPSPARPAEIVDLRDCVIVPGFVDAHTHPLFAGMRERGQTMLDTVQKTREALKNPSAFWKTVETRLKLMLAHGTTTAEVKTGYALTKAGELQMLDLIEAHKDEPGLPRLVATFLGAHAVPREFENADAYVDYLIAEVLPEARAHGAVNADVFCEPGFFSPAQTLRYLNASRSQGLRLRAHCDEMSYSGAAATAAQAGVDTVDHCNYIREEDIAAIVQREIVTVACPATTAYLDLPERAPVRAILEGGGTVALASDYNPGTSPCFNLQTVASYGRRLFGLSAAEALYGVTVASAKSLRLPAGRIRAGDPADFVALQIGSPDEFGWQFGGNLAAAVYRSGERIV